MGVVGALVFACLLSSAVWIGVDVWQLHKVRLCVADLKEFALKLQELPEKYRQKTEHYRKELRNLEEQDSKNTDELTLDADSAWYHLEYAKSDELLREATSEKHADSKKEEAIRGKIKAVPSELKKETCEVGAAVLERFKQCQDHLWANVVYIVFKPKGILSAGSLQSYIDKAADMVSNAGCSAAEAHPALMRASDVSDSLAPVAACSLMALLSALALLGNAAKKGACARRSYIGGLHEPLVV